MNSLIGYASSDEEEDDIPSQGPAKVAKLDENPPSHLTAPLKTPTAHPEAQIETQPLKASTINPPPVQHAPAQDQQAAAGPTQGPTIPTLDEPAAAPSDAPAPLSPYTFTRQRLRDLTMPPVPNFSIPDAPSPPPETSEEGAALAQTTKQFERFLELKRKGVHFNERLQNTASLRNPSLLAKLLDFAGVEGQEAYESTLPEGLGVPVRWPEDCYVEGLLRANERRERKKLAEREKLDFVSAQQQANEGSGKAVEGEGRRSKFDRR